MENKQLPPFVTRALAGDTQAVEELLTGIQDRVFNLSLRFLGDPIDAQDACQEICLKVWGKLDTFKGESQFFTWVLAIARNHLIGVKKSRMEKAGISFEAYEAESGLVPASLNPGEGIDEHLFSEELRHSCSLGMLQCLNRTDRLIYVLHVFFAVSSETGGLICELTPAAYRQRLSRARKKMASFLTRICGLAGSGAGCRCHDRVVYAFQQGRISLNRLFYATHIHPETIREMTDSMEVLEAESAVFRQDEMFRSAETITSIRKILFKNTPTLLRPE